MSRPRFRLVHLDLDGTLVDTAEDLVASTNHVRESFGLAPLEASEVTRLVGHGARVLVERALGPDRRDRHDEGVRRLLEHYEVHCLDRSRPYPGMAELIDGLAAEGVRFSVLTNKPERLARKILAGLDLERRVAAVVGGDTFPERKPHPRGAEHVRSLLGAVLDECLMVGDSAVDVETARAAGIACCGVLWGFDTDGLRAAAPTFVARDGAELARLIGGD